MKRLIAMLLVAGSLSAGSLYQQWSEPYLQTSVDNYSITGPDAVGVAVTVNYLVVSLWTLDYRVHGFCLDLAVALDDGSLLSIGRSNLTLDKKGAAVVRVPLGVRTPLSIVRLTVQRLVTEETTVLVGR